MVNQLLIRVCTNVVWLGVIVIVGLFLSRAFRTAPKLRQSLQLGQSLQRDLGAMPREVTQSRAEDPARHAHVAGQRRESSRVPLVLKLAGIATAALDF